MLQKEEAELERLREKERIRSGKELLEAKRKEDDLKLKRNLELRRMEKEEEARARDKIRVKLGTHPHALLTIPFQPVSSASGSPSKCLRLKIHGLEIHPVLFATTHCCLDYTMLYML